MSRFINTELKSDSDSDSDPDLDSEKVGQEFDNELMAKLELVWSVLNFLTLFYKKISQVRKSTKPLTVNKRKKCV